MKNIAGPSYMRYCVFVPDGNQKREVALLLLFERLLTRMLVPKLRFVPITACFPPTLVVGGVLIV
jgi:hypothetical protein